MNSNLFFYLFYNIHNGVFFKHITFNWVSRKYFFDGNSFYDSEIKNIFAPVSITDFTRNAEYFIEFDGFNKEVDLFNPNYFHETGESLYSLTLDFIFMAYSKTTMREIFTLDDSYEKLFADIAAEYANHTKKNAIQYLEREKWKKEQGFIITRPNFGHTNSSLGYFSNSILNEIQLKYNLNAFPFKNHNDIYDYFVSNWNNKPIILQELLITKKIIDTCFSTTANFHEIRKKGFEINREISKLIDSLIKLKHEKYS